MIKELIQKELNIEDTSAFDEPIETLGIDSMDLITLRVKLEKQFGKEVPDEIWLTMSSLSELVSFFSEDVQASNGIHNSTLKSEEFEHKRSHQVNMPQMALGGLSESWLLKEMGDFHWFQLCEGLNTKSFDLTDQTGERLYATFVRIKHESKDSLAAFQENEKVEMGGSMTRFGSSMYFSKNAIFNDNKRIDFNMMTTFSSRGRDNSKLTKGKPNSRIQNDIIELNDMPDFGQKYRMIRKQVDHSLQLSGVNFKMIEHSIFEFDYDINPYHDINGVNLLYFAAYPIISDFCEFNYIKKEKDFSRTNTIARDVFYFSNCNIDDNILYKLNEFELLENNRAKIQSTLIRKSDNKTLAKIFTIKEIV